VDKNLLLAFALSFLVLSTWSMWQRSTRPPSAPTAQEMLEGQVEREAPQSAGEPERYRDLPSVDPVAPLPRSRESAGEAPSGELIEITRPLYSAELDSRGGVIARWELAEYADEYGDPVVLIDAQRGVGGVAATPLVELGFGDLSQVVWRAEEQGTDSIAFEIEQEGVRIHKLYSFDSESYSFRLLVEIENNSDGVIRPRFLVDWPTLVREGNDFREQALAALHQGDVAKKMLAGLGSPGFFGRLSGKKPVDAYEPLIGEIDWAGVDTPYFWSAVLPDTPDRASARFVVLERSEAGAVEVFFDPVEVPPGQSVAREFRGYVGPKELERLELLGPGAVAAIDVGWSWVAPLTRFFSWLLGALYSIIPNYGVAIVLLTILVRVFTAPLTIKQMRSMERMRRLQPKLKEIQAKFADDRQKQSEEMMRLYKQEKVNPLGGCFPMLLQFPVFIGLYWALRSSIQLRQAPFFGWIDDLSAPETLFDLPGIGIPVRVLPLIMGATMVLQQKITPMQADPAQARMMMTIMPIMMTVIFYQFPSGLVLYWMLSSVLAIGHQLWIGRKMQPIDRGNGKEREAKAA
jgi:YidC/Oxa1 family membrane protein insertase